MRKLYVQDNLIELVDSPNSLLTKSEYDLYLKLASNQTQANATLSHIWNNIVSNPFINKNPGQLFSIAKSYMNQMSQNIDSSRENCLECEKVAKKVFIDMLFIKEIAKMQLGAGTLLVFFR